MNAYISFLSLFYGEASIPPAMTPSFLCPLVTSKRKIVRGHEDDLSRRLVDHPNSSHGAFRRRTRRPGSITPDEIGVKKLIPMLNTISQRAQKNHKIDGPLR